MINWEKIQHGTLNIGYKQCVELFDTGSYKLKDTDGNEVEYAIQTPGVTTFKHTPIGNVKLLSIQLTFCTIDFVLQFLGNVDCFACKKSTFYRFTTSVFNKADIEVLF